MKREKLWSTRPVSWRRATSRSKEWTSKRYLRRWQGWNPSACCWRSRHIALRRSTTWTWSLLSSTESWRRPFVRQPPDFLDNNNPDKILRLHKALYRRRQAPRAWNAKLDNMLNWYDNPEVQALCLWAWHVHARSRRAPLIVGVYVDDLIITGGDIEVLGRFKREMSKNFKMSDLGVLNYYLGIEVQ